MFFISDYEFTLSIKLIEYAHLIKKIIDVVIQLVWIFLMMLSSLSKFVENHSLVNVSVSR